MGLLKFLTGFDWVSPLVAITDDLTHGGPLNMDVWNFWIPWDAATLAGWGEFTILEKLEKYGVEAWGGLLFDGEYVFKVRLDQARLAEWVLVSNGIPLVDHCQGAPEKRR